MKQRRTAYTLPCFTKTVSFKPTYQWKRTSLFSWQLKNSFKEFNKYNFKYWIVIKWTLAYFIIKFVFAKFPSLWIFRLKKMKPFVREHGIRTPHLTVSKAWRSPYHRFPELAQKPLAITLLYLRIQLILLQVNLRFRKFPANQDKTCLLEHPWTSLKNAVAAKRSKLIASFTHLSFPLLWTKHTRWYKDFTTTASYSPFTEGKSRSLYKQVSEASTVAYTSKSSTHVTKAGGLLLGYKVSSRLQAYRVKTLS